MPRHRIDLAGEAGHPEGVDDVDAADRDVDGGARGQVQDVPGRDAAMIGIAEGPEPLPTLGLDPRRRASRQRQEPLASDQCIGDERRQDGGRQNEATRPTSVPTTRGSTVPPVSCPVGRDHRWQTSPAPGSAAAGTLRGRRACPRYSGSHATLCWREMDSNHRYPANFFGCPVDPANSPSAI